MTEIQIGNNKYSIRYTIESWKKLKEKGDITPNNVQEKIKEDMAGCISNLIYYGLSQEMRKDVKMEDVDLTVGFEVVDTIVSAIAESMPKPKASSASDGGEGAEAKK